MQTKSKINRSDVHTTNMGTLGFNPYAPAPYTSEDVGYRGYSTDYVPTPPATPKVDLNRTSYPEFLGTPPSRIPTQEEVVVSSGTGDVVNGSPNKDTAVPKNPIIKTEGEQPNIEWQWDEVQAPDSFRSRQKERRAYYTNLLATGNLGKAFGAMYAIEEENVGRWKRNSNRDYLMEKGYTPQSVQAYIKSGNQEVLSKAPKLDTGFVNLPDGRSGLMNLQTGELITQYQGVKKTNLERVELANGQIGIVDMGTGNLVKQFGPTRLTATQEKSKTEAASIPTDLEAMFQGALSRYKTLGDENKYTWVGTVAGNTPGTGFANEASEIDQILSEMTVDKYTNMTGAAGMTGPLERVLMKSVPTRGSSEHVVSKYAADLVEAERQTAIAMRDKLIRTGAPEAQITRAQEIIDLLASQREGYLGLSRKFEGGSAPTTSNYGAVNDDIAARAAKYL